MRYLIIYDTNNSERYTLDYFIRETHDEILKVIALLNINIDELTIYEVNDVIEPNEDDKVVISQEKQRLRDARESERRKNANEMNKSVEKHEREELIRLKNKYEHK